MPEEPDEEDRESDEPSTEAIGANPETSKSCKYYLSEEFILHKILYSFSQHAKLIEIKYRNVLFLFYFISSQ